MLSELETNGEHKPSVSVENSSTKLASLLKQQTFTDAAAEIKASFGKKKKKV